MPRDLAHTIWVASGYASRQFDSLVAKFLLKMWRVNGGRKLVASGRPHLYRAPGGNITIGDSCTFLSRWNANLHGLTRPCMISALCRGSKITIGDHSGFSGTVIACAESVAIGSRVMCGANTLITDTDSHSLDYRQRFPNYHFQTGERYAEIVKTSPVIIGNDVFIGMNTLVLKGVSLGDRCVIGAGSVVTHSIPEDCIAAGVPARVIRKMNTV